MLYDPGRECLFPIHPVRLCGKSGEPVLKVKTFCSVVRTLYMPPYQSPNSNMKVLMKVVFLIVLSIFPVIFLPPWQDIFTPMDILPRMVSPMGTWKFPCWRYAANHTNREAVLSNTT